VGIVEPLLAFKLTTQKLQTHGGFQWEPGRWESAVGDGVLCSSAWLHFYESAEIAALMNPIHASIRDPILWRAEVSGKLRADGALKFGATRGRITERATPPKYTTTQRVAFAILLCYDRCDDVGWRAWADRWLCGEDRSAKSANSAATAAGAAATAAGAAADAACRERDSFCLHVHLCAEAAKDF